MSPEDFSTGGAEVITGDSPAKKISVTNSIKSISITAGTVALHVFRRAGCC
jgi:hypothetical protein